MVSLTEKARQWPRRENGEPIFKTTNEAIFYANLIHNNKRLVDEIHVYRGMARRVVKLERVKNDPDYDTLMELAVRGQLFRECMDEVKRIREEQPRRRE